MSGFDFDSDNEDKERTSRGWSLSWSECDEADFVAVYNDTRDKTLHSITFQHKPLPAHVSLEGLEGPLEGDETALDEFVRRVSLRADRGNVVTMEVSGAALEENVCVGRRGNPSQDHLPPRAFLPPSHQSSLSLSNTLPPATVGRGGGVGSDGKGVRKDTHSSRGLDAQRTVNHNPKSLALCTPVFFDTPCYSSPATPPAPRPAPACER